MRTPTRATNATLGGDYPRDWNGFIGQESAKRHLRIAAASARMRNAPLGHVLLKSPVPGIGKTSMALLTAMEADRPYHIVSGTLKMMDARVLLTKMADHDLLIIDEIHRCFTSGKANGEWLLHYLQDGVLMGPLGAEQAPRVTIIGATTDAGRLPEPVLQRFEINLTLQPYTDHEACLIALELAQRVLPEPLPMPTADVAAAVALAASNQPRLMRQIWCSLRDLVMVGELAAEPGYDLTDVLALCGLTDDGLTPEALSYLDVLYHEFSGQAGAKPLADRLGEVGDGLAMTERLLMDKGYLTKTRQGRILTREGLLRARALKEAS